MPDFDAFGLGSSFATAFFASAVEFVEALTIVLATGGARGWRAVLAGVATAVALLVLVVAAVGTSLVRLPLRPLRLVIGAVLLLFGMRWLRKAVLRGAGLLPLRDEAVAFTRVSGAMRARAAATGWDSLAFAAGFQVMMVEGAEVAIVVVGVGEGADRLLVPASLGAAAAFVLVALLGLIVHRPLARIPENRLKFMVGAVLCGLGCLWFGEAIGLRWPGGDWSLPVLVAGFVVAGLGGIATGRQHARSAPGDR